MEQDGPQEQAAPDVQGSSILISQPALEVEVLKSYAELFAWYFLAPRTGSSGEAQEGAAPGSFPARHILISAYGKGGKIRALSLVPVRGAGSSWAGFRLTWAWGGGSHRNVAAGMILHLALPGPCFLRPWDSLGDAGSQAAG